MGRKVRCGCCCGRGLTNDGQGSLLSPGKGSNSRREAMFFVLTHFRAREEEEGRCHRRIRTNWRLLLLLLHFPWLLHDPRGQRGPAPWLRPSKPYWRKRYRRRSCVVYNFPHRTPQGDPRVWRGSKLLSEVLLFSILSRAGRFLLQVLIGRAIQEGLLYTHSTTERRGKRKYVNS